MHTLKPGRADSSDGSTYISQNMLMRVVEFVLCARAFGCLYEICCKPQWPSANCVFVLLFVCSCFCLYEILPQFCVLVLLCEFCVLVLLRIKTHTCYIDTVPVQQISAQVMAKLPPWMVPWWHGWMVALWIRPECLDVGGLSILVYNGCRGMGG